MNETLFKTRQPGGLMASSAKLPQPLFGSRFFCQPNDRIVPCPPGIRSNDQRAIWPSDSWSGGDPASTGVRIQAGHWLAPGVISVAKRHTRISEILT